MGGVDEYCDGGEVIVNESAHGKFFAVYQCEGIKIIFYCALFIRQEVVFRVLVVDELVDRFEHVVETANGFDSRQTGHPVRERFYFAQEPDIHHTVFYWRFYRVGQGRAAIHILSNLVVILANLVIICDEVQTIKVSFIERQQHCGEYCQCRATEENGFIPRMGKAYHPF